MSDFGNILTRMLSAVPDSQDKRESSPIYNTLAPTAAELAEINILTEIFRDQTYLLTATGENLENRAAESGIVRSGATFAIRIAAMLDTAGNHLDLPIGSRFSIPNVGGGLNYVLTQNLSVSGQCLLTCETAGTIGNSYLGALLPLFVINNLGSATMTGTYTPAEDTETDEELRARVIERVNRKAFGGNIADYKQFTKAIPGVGDVKVFPIWNGGGTVMLSVIDAEYNAITPEFTEVVQNEIDPVDHTGTGLGTAPIGHRVTVTTPQYIAISITASVSLASGYTMGQVQEPISSALADYILEIRKQWADANMVSVYSARVTSVIIGIAGINNVINVTINGSSDDFSMEQTSGLQQLPIFEGVVLSYA